MDVPSSGRVVVVLNVNNSHIDWILVVYDVDKGHITILKPKFCFSIKSSKQSGLGRSGHASQPGSSASFHRLSYYHA